MGSMPCVFLGNPEKLKGTICDGAKPWGLN